MWCDKRVMSTTMMNHSRRQIQPPTVPSNKRKERDGGGGGGVKQPSVAVTTKSLAKPSIHHRGPPPQQPPVTVRSPHPVTNNHLLAGYLAHEFLNNGTLFGEPWDPVQPVPLIPSSTRLKPSGSDKRKGETSSENQVEKQKRYVEVANLLKENGTYIPGIVNPKQLARYLHLDC